MDGQTVVVGPRRRRERREIIIIEEPALATILFLLVGLALGLALRKDP